MVPISEPFGMDIEVINVLIGESESILEEKECSTFE